MKRSIILLLHGGYWVLYSLLLAFIQLLLSIGRGSFIFQHARGVVFFTAFALVPALISFYLFYNIIFTRWLSRNKLVVFFVAVILTPVGCALIGWLLLYAIWGMLVGTKGPSLFQGGTSEFVALILIMWINTFANGVIALVLKGFIKWYGDINLKMQLEQKNYEIELALVKSQISPHFLFNTLNNIDVLIETDPPKASVYLQQLSDIVRFMLYETKTETIPLATEINYITKYINLQKIRTSNQHFVNFMVKGNPAGHNIAPMLFIVFIENAFKHAESKKNGISIRIYVNIEESKIEFFCENAKATWLENEAETGGLGNELIYKRLNLLYPGRHELSVINGQNNYTVKLTIYNHAN